jgi:8-oxo-dGTP pyrophosphatase MutT (NUDIX family)
MPHVPVSKPDAALVVLERADGRVLGVSRPHDPDDFGLPGGSVEPDERAEDGAAREVLEETGLMVGPLEPLETVTYRGRSLHCFIARTWSGTLRRSLEGAVDWVTWEQLGRGTYGEYNRRLHAAHPWKGR